MTITITKGDSIHHPHHGIGTVQSIRKRSFSGSTGRKFAKLFFPREEMVMMIGENELHEHIRKPIQKSEAKKVLEHISEWSELESDQWKARANAQQAKLDDGNPIAIAEVYKTLSRRMADDKLSAADRRQLSQAEERLIEELSMAMGQPAGKTCKRMEKAAGV